jgi:hypothetical protein
MTDGWRLQDLKKYDVLFRLESDNDGCNLQRFDFPEIRGNSFHIQQAFISQQIFRSERSIHHFPRF